MNYQLIGNRIREWRIRKSMSQEVLAEKIGISVRHVSYVENAKRCISLEALVSIANVLGTTVDSLLAGNQQLDLLWYGKAVSSIFDDCNDYEERVLYTVLMDTKQALRDNQHLFATDKPF